MLIDSRVWMDDESNEKTRPMFDQFVPCQTPCVCLSYTGTSLVRARLRTRQRRTNEGSARTNYVYERTTKDKRGYTAL